MSQEWAARETHTVASLLHPQFASHGSRQCTAEPVFRSACRQRIEQLFTLDGTIDLHQAGLSVGDITVQCHRFGRPRSRSGLSVFQGAGQSSSSDPFQYLKRTGCVTLLRKEFEVLEVGLTHSRGYGAVPIG